MLDLLGKRPPRFVGCVFQPRALISCRAQVQRVQFTRQRWSLPRSGDLRHLPVSLSDDLCLRIRIRRIVLHQQGKFWYAAYCVKEHADKDARKCTIQCLKLTRFASGCFRMAAWHEKTPPDISVSKTKHWRCGRWPGEGRGASKLAGGFSTSKMTSTPSSAAKRRPDRSPTLNHQRTKNMKTLQFDFSHLASHDRQQSAARSRALLADAVKRHLAPITRAQGARQTPLKASGHLAKRSA